ncbi:MAG TPA: hypothetical protein VEQ66_05265 [Propionibacteriaceae bacterium]|nr:hypothetical protein [Propionibacteriaceae bacterium]
MSQDATDSDSLGDEEYGNLTIEDDAEGTVDPGELAGTASSDDDSVGYQPEFSEGDVDQP